MQAILTATATATLRPAPRVWYSLPSSEWTSDKKPRQMSDDFRRERLKDFGAVVGLPDYYRLRGDPWVVLDRTRQVWLADVLGLAWIGTPYSGITRKSTKEEFIYWWKQYLADGRCFTNKTAWNNGRVDFIQGVNIGAKAMEWECLLLAGNKVDVLGEGTFPERYTGTQAAYKHYRVRAIDPRKLPTPEAFLLDKYVCHIPTTIKPDGTRGIFPQFNGRAVYPFWQVGDCYVWDRLIG